MNLPARCTSRAIPDGEDGENQLARVVVKEGHRQEERRQSRHDPLSTPANMWLVFSRRPVTSTMTPCARMNSTNQKNAMKWTDRIACRLNSFPIQPNLLFEVAGLCIRPVAIDTEAATKTVMK